MLQCIEKRLGIRLNYETELAGASRQKSWSGAAEIRTILAFIDPSNSHMRQFNVPIRCQGGAMLDKNKIYVLETTLRDGSYVIDFQFTEKDTEILTRYLDELHLPFIEVGHGIGINASPSKGKAAATDIEYIEAARRGAKKAQVGMFCIPGIATLDHLRACADAGLQFVRIGVNVDHSN
jgi:hypothetical protein